MHKDRHQVNPVCAESVLAAVSSAQFVTVRSDGKTHFLFEKRLMSGTFDVQIEVKYAVYKGFGYVLYGACLVLHLCAVRGKCVHKHIGCEYVWVYM